MTARQLSDGNEDGTILGQSASDLVGFYGATATAQPVSTAIVLSTAAVSVSATQWGYSTSTQADAIVTLIRALRSDLIALGLKAS